jgi:hypothetical protein
MREQRVHALLIHWILKHKLDFVVFSRYSIIRADRHGSENITLVLELPTQDCKVGQVGQTGESDKAGENPKELLNYPSLRTTHWW